MADSISFARYAIIRGQLKRAGKIISECCGDGQIRFEFLDEQLPVYYSVVKWEAQRNRAIFSLGYLGDTVPQERKEYFTNRLLYTLPLIVQYHRKGREQGSIFISLDDSEASPGLSFCTNSNDQFPIPDPDFLTSRGYKAFRQQLAREQLPWEQRHPMVFWRGATSGIRLGDGWRTLPRIRLCEIARSSDFFDVGIARIVQVSEQEALEINSSGLMRDEVPAITFADYRVQIDIDGNANSWSGLFTKLLTNSPVLKVDSPHNFRQWYYNHLVPWENYVPVESDMSDLVEKARWLIAHDDMARQIGSRGAELAEAITYEAALQSGVITIEEAIRQTRKTVLEN
jgi:hypothetical protein